MQVLQTPWSGINVRPADAEAKVIFHSINTKTGRPGCLAAVMFIDKSKKKRSSGAKRKDIVGWAVTCWSCSDI